MVTQEQIAKADIHSVYDRLKARWRREFLYEHLYGYQVRGEFDRQLSSEIMEARWEQVEQLIRRLDEEIVNAKFASGKEQESSDQSIIIGGVDEGEGCREGTGYIRVGGSVA